ncbi:CC166 protein, partial [Upupa epops]|nr:CC166 protein [Upupa epops]
MASEAIQMKQGTVSPAKDKEGVRAKNGNLSKGTSDMETLVTEEKSYLQKEYKILNEHMNTYMGKLEHFLQENKVLEEEAQECQQQSNAYLCYRTKHSQKYQNLVITLNDQNRADLSQVQLQKEKLISQYTEKEEEVRSSLKNMETKYSLMSKEAEELLHFKNQLDYTEKIKELEKQLLVAKIQHSEEMHKVTRRFLQAKADCETAFHQKIQALTKRAKAAAVWSLIQHLKQVKAENWHLHQELLSHIQYSKILKETEVKLRKQQQQLLWENQLLRTWHVNTTDYTSMKQSGNGETHSSHSLLRCVR